MSTAGDITTMLGSNTEDVCLKGRTSDKHRGTFEPWTAIHSNIDWEWSLPTLRNLKAYLQLLVITYMIYKGIILSVLMFWIKLYEETEFRL